MNSFAQKKERLLLLLQEYGDQDLAVAFSGGTDSSLLLKLACDQAKKKGRTVWAVTVSSELQPEQDMEIARRVAREAGAEHAVLRIRELDTEGIRRNTKERCYLCKRLLFSAVRSFAGEKGAAAVLEGTNEDDLHVYRPGIRALKELGIQSPLAEAGLTKEEVRRMAAEYGISVAGRPSAPCLATRFPYGTELSVEELKRAERGEDFLHRLGFPTVRLRVHRDVARLEIPADELPRLLEYRQEVSGKLRDLGYRYVTADLEGFRSGSMDEE
jgi:uncharacterized protein